MAFVRKEKKHFLEIWGTMYRVHQWAKYVYVRCKLGLHCKLGIYQIAGGGWAGMSQPGNGGVVGRPKARRGRKYGS